MGKLGELENLLGNVIFPVKLSLDMGEHHGAQDSCKILCLKKCTALHVMGQGQQCMDKNEPCESPIINMRHNMLQNMLCTVLKESTVMW